MRRALVILCGMLCASIAQAQTADARLMRSARAITRINLVEPTCGPFYVLDRKVLAAIRGAVTGDAIDRFGERLVRDKIEAVKFEFAAEIARRGAASWCPAQRKVYAGMGFPDLIGDNLP